MHGLILIPYYFVGALAALPLLMLVCRVLRLRLAINTLVLGAIVLTVAGLVVPLAADWVDLRDFTGLRLAALIVLSFLFSGLDAALARVLPVPLDAELREL